MAPTKNTHSNCNNNSGQYTPNSNNSSDHNNSVGSQNNVGAVNASGSSGHTHKRNTGTVPKATAPVQRLEREGATQPTKTLTTNPAPPVAGAGNKTGKSTTKRSAASLLHQQKQLQQQQPLAHGLFATERAGPFNIVTSTQQQQQQQQQQHQQQQQQQQQQHQHQRKNTEIVAPIRRELKDLNDYLLSAVATTNNSSQQQIHAQQQHQLKQHNYSKCQQPQQQQQVNENNTATSGGIDIETIPDSQSRFCYPVRPIPRRNLQQNDSTNDYNTSYSTASAIASTAATTSNLNLLNHPAAVGVVIPTTPSIVHNSNISASINDEIVANNHLSETTTRSNNISSNNSNINTTINQQQLLLLQQLQHQIEEQSSLLLAASYHQQQQPRSPNLLELAGSSLSAVAASNTQTLLAPVAVNDVNLLQRLQLIQQILSLSSKPNLAAVPAVQISAAPTQQQCNKAPNMVNEVRSPTANERDVIVNSNSLEDVALSEISDNRAQSIQSLHSAHEETPTPDNTPGYDELQQRLEASNRNIQNIQEQQQQLLRLQQQAKQHLNEMEALRHQAPALSFGQQNGGNSNDPPEYQSIEQVHSDMSALVGRMKNLTTFIQHQNDLGNLLGDDGPDILAEQEALQRKLESLRVQRDEMRSLVGELQDINRNAERTAEQRRQDNEQQQRQEEPPVVTMDNTTAVAPPTSSTTHRVVPVEYSRIVPIELLQAATAQFPATESGEDPAAAEMMRQKVADIATMKAQLKRLKDMMQTVNLIEEHTARTEPKDIGRNVPISNNVDISVQRERSCSYDRDRTPTASDGNEDNNDFMSAKVRMLNEVTSDLRAQALSLQAERDRIKALKEEIVRRKAEAAAAAQVNEDALKRNTSQLMQRRQEEEQGERDLLKEEYEVKKKEFEQLCQRLQLDNVCHTSTPTTAQRPRTNGTHDMVSEADDEAEVEEELNDSDFGAATTAVAANKYFTAQSCSSQQPPVKHATPVASPVSAPNQRNDKHIIEESSAAAAPANTTHDTAASLEAASMQSGSSQSYSMPPPMHQLGGPPTSSWLPGPIPPPLPTSWNPHLYYGGASSQPFATQFTPPHFSGIHGSVVGLHSQHHPPAPSSADCICSASNGASTLGAAVNVTAAGTTSASTAPITADPMLLQQFVQTQQMLINSVCQCNQMLWHQQREIDALNNTIHMLQDRLITLAGPSSADLAFNIRAESVPPPTSLSGAIHTNNVYASLQNRAQSEQPTGFLPLPRSSAFSNYHQQQQHLFQQRQQRSAGGYNYATELQQHQQQNASSSGSIFTTLNNAAPPPPPQFNNEAPQSPMTAAGPGPIFMHHHNNTIHQNNANLRTQNQHANNLQQQQQPHSNIAVNGGGSTLNNQVPPGNRANNYWDNFRSYSRQNLLSTNSNKSNEDQNQQHMQQQQQQQQQLQQQYQTPHILPLPELPQEQQLPQQAQHLYPQRQINQQNSISNDCNNLNYDRNNSGGSSNNNNANCNKYLRSVQRSRINQLQQQQQQQLASMLSTANAANNIYQANVPSSSARELLENLNWIDNVGVEEDSNIFDNYNISANNDMSATYAGMARNMNMNLNFGNNMQYQRNKVPAKPACQGATMHRGNLQQPYLNVADTQRYDMLTAGVTATTASPPQQPPTAAVTSVAASTTTSNPRNRERDFLLCTVDMAAGYNYAPSAAVTDDFTAENSLSTANVDEDTTSEEIKRNLLVNALKNDKFTTKFYESIKEDVFRRLESLLLEKDGTEPSHSSSSTQQQCLLNDVDSAARYPTRKLYLNAQMGNQQQQQQSLQQQSLSPQTGNQQQQQQPLSQQIKQELDVVEAYCDSNNAEEAESNNAEETESNNADDNDLSSTSQATAVAENNFDVAASLENEEPEENENRSHNMATSTTSLRTVATVLNTSSSPNEVHQVVNRTTISAEQARPLVSTDIGSSSKKRKNQRQQRNNISDVALNSDSGTLAVEELQSRTTTNPNNNYNKLYENDSPDSELVNYIITRIHNQTPANTLINDTLLVEIAKLTAAAVQISTSKNIASATTADGSNSTAIQQQQLIISPKKLYAKIRKKSIPRQRDEFLAWYQGYLEGFLFVNNHNQNNNNNNTKQAAIEKKLPQRNKQPQQVAVEGKLVNTNSGGNKSQFKLQNLNTTTITTQANSSSNNNNNNIQVNVDNLDINDADLAEADQICSANTSSNASNTLPHSEDVANIDHINFVNCNEKNDDVFSDNQVDELENNENPEEEGATACSVLLEKHDVTAEEKQQKDENNIASITTTATTATITVADFNINAQDFAALTTSSNSDNTEDTGNNSSGRAKKSKQEFHKRNSVA